MIRIKIQLQSSENILIKSPLTLLCQRGEPIFIPLWKRGIEGDFKMRLKKLPNGLTIRGIFH